MYYKELMSYRNYRNQSMEEIDILLQNEKRNSPNRFVIFRLLYILSLFYIYIIDISGYHIMFI